MDTSKDSVDTPNEDLALEPIDVLEQVEAMKRKAEDLAAQAHQMAVDRAQKR